MAAANMAAGQKHKQATSASPDDWTIRERLILASSVVRSGDQNWVSVSRAMKPVVEQGPSARPRPPDFFSQKNCAVHYSNMLEKVATPKRKRTEGGGAETPGEQIVRTLTFERMEELKKSIKNDHLRFRALRARIEGVRNGKYDEKLQDMCSEIEVRRNRKKEMLAKANSSHAEPDANLPSTPTTPTPPTPLSGGSRPGMQPLPSPQKGKQQRIPKPTEKFQKYQQQQRQRHGHATQQAQFPGQPSEAVVNTGVQPNGLASSKMLGIEQTAVVGGTQMSIRESSEMENRSKASAVNNNQSSAPATAPQSPWKQEPVPQSPSTAPARQVPVGNSSAPSESALLSLLSQPPKDLKQTVIELSEQDPPGQKDEGPHTASSTADPRPPDTPSKETNPQNTDGKPFLGVGSSGESKKLDSIRDKRASTSQVPAASVAPPSVSAPTLSKLLTAVTSSGMMGLNASNPHTTSPKSAPVTKVSIGVESVGSVEGSSLLGRRGGGITVGGQGDDGGGQVTALSFSPKSGVKVPLPSPMAITPPPNTPPADKKEMIPETLVEAEEKTTAEEKNSTSETASVKNEEPMKPASSSKGDEPKVEEKEVVDVSPKMTTRTRASKPGRPGRPPKIARRQPRGRTKSSNSTDNEVEVVETQAEVEVMDVESEKASDKGEEEEESLPAVVEEKKEEPAVNEEEEDEAEQEDEKEEEEESLDDGDRSQLSEPGSSLKELIDKQDATGLESVPASPCSQVSLGSGDDPEAVQAQKTWKKSIMLVWRAAANHKYANVFLHAVTDDEAPGYHSVVFRPMDLTTIKKSIENGTIRTTSEFQRDMMLMFQNALMYNNSDHDVYRMAQEMRDDVMEQIQSYIATQLMVRSSDRESKMLRGHRTDVFHFFL